MSRHPEGVIIMTTVDPRRRERPMTETTSDLLETAFASISKAVDDLRAERDLYRNGLQLIARDGETDEGAKIIALLFLGRVVVTSELPNKNCKKGMNISKLVTWSCRPRERVGIRWDGSPSVTCTIVAPNVCMQRNFIGICLADCLRRATRDNKPIRVSLVQ